MKKVIWITVMFAVFLVADWSCPAQVPAFNWVQQAGGSGTIQSLGLAADGSGNIYVTGAFVGNCTFGSNTLNSAVNDDYGFVAKYDWSGHALWGAGAGGTDTVTIIRLIGADGFGNSFVCGGFSPLHSSGFHSIGFGNLTITNTSFIAKLDPTGNVLWAQPCGGSTVQPSALAADASGDCYLTGSFNGNATFGGTTLYGSTNFFIAKFSGNGPVMWAKQADVTSGTAGANRIALDGAGDVLVLGSFSGTVLWGNQLVQTNLTSRGYSDLFLAKYDNAGRAVWVSSFGSTNTSTGGISLAVGSDNSPCLAEYSQSNGTTASFLTKYSASGNLLWTTGFPSNAGVGSTTVGLSNSICVTGEYSGSPVFGATNLPSYTNGSFFLAKYDSSGNLQWASGYGGPGGAGVAASVTSVLGDIYITGGFSATVAFGGIVLTSGADTDLFLADLNTSGNLLPPTLSLRMYPGITIDGFAGRLYDIQYSDSLNTNWQNLTNIVLPYSPFILFDTSPLSSSRFYRVGPLQP